MSNWIRSVKEQAEGNEKILEVSRDDVECGINVTCVDVKGWEGERAKDRRWCNRFPRDGAWRRCWSTDSSAAMARRHGQLLLLVSTGPQDHRSAFPHIPSNKQYREIRWLPRRALRLFQLSRSQLLTWSNVWL